MYCPYCGHENADTNKFCVYCGRQLSIQDDSRNDINNSAENNLESDYMSTHEQAQYYANVNQSNNPYQPPSFEQSNHQYYQNTQQNNAQQQNNNPNQPPNYQPYNSNSNGVKVVLIILAIFVGIAVLKGFAGFFFNFFPFWWY